MLNKEVIFKTFSNMAHSINANRAKSVNIRSINGASKLLSCRSPLGGQVSLTGCCTLLHLHCLLINSIK